MGYISESDQKRFGKDFLDGIMEWIADNFSPDDVFRTTQLEDWANANGFILRSEVE